MERTTGVSKRKNSNYWCCSLVLIVDDVNFRVLFLLAKFLLNLFIDFGLMLRKILILKLIKNVIDVLCER